MIFYYRDGALKNVGVSMFYGSPVVEKYLPILKEIRYEQSETTQEHYIQVMNTRKGL